jgi:hypothetical protein
VTITGEELRNTVELGIKRVIERELIDSGAILSSGHFHVTNRENFHSRRLFEPHVLFERIAPTEAQYLWLQRLIAYPIARFLLKYDSPFDALLFSDRTPALMGNALQEILAADWGKEHELVRLDRTLRRYRGKRVAILVSVVNSGRSVQRAVEATTQWGCIPPAPAASIVKFDHAVVPADFCALWAVPDVAYLHHAGEDEKKCEACQQNPEVHKCPFCRRGEPCLDLERYPRQFQLSRGDGEGFLTQGVHSGLSFSDFWSCVITVEGLTAPPIGQRGRHHHGTFIDTDRIAQHGMTADFTGKLRSTALRMLQEAGVTKEPPERDAQPPAGWTLVPVFEADSHLGKTLADALHQSHQGYLPFESAVPMDYDRDLEQFVIPQRLGTMQRAVLILSGLSSGQTMQRALSSLAMQSSWSAAVLGFVNRLAPGPLNEALETLAAHHNARLLAMYNAPLPSFDAEHCPKERDHQRIQSIRNSPAISDILRNFLKTTTLDQLSFRWRCKAFSRAASQIPDDRNLVDSLVHCYQLITNKFGGDEPTTLMSLGLGEEPSISKEMVYTAWVATDAAAKAGPNLLKRIADDYCESFVSGERIPEALASSVIRGLSCEQVEGAVHDAHVNPFNDLILESLSAELSLESFLALVESRAPGWETHLPFIVTHKAADKGQLYGVLVIRLLLSSDDQGDLLSRVLTKSAGQHERVWERFTRDIQACLAVVRRNSLPVARFIWDCPQESMDLPAEAFSDSEVETAKQKLHPCLVLDLIYGTVEFDGSLMGRAKKGFAPLLATLKFLPDRSMTTEALTTLITECSRDQRTAKNILTLFNSTNPRSVKEIPLNRYWSDFKRLSRKPQPMKELIARGILTTTGNGIALRHDIYLLVVLPP